MKTGTLLAVALLSACAPVWAGRPLATDDASVVDSGSCYAESWLERSGSDRAFVVAPACSVAKGVEIGADATLPHPRDVLRGAAGLGLKWVPEAWQVDSAAGPLAFGIKLGTAWEQPASEGWRNTESGAIALATWTASDTWTLNANLGFARNRAGSTTAGLLNLAVVWSPHEDGLLFAETQANSRSSVFGGTVNSTGGRWWAIKDRLGFDLTASRQAGGDTSWSVGLGWYGLSF